MATLTIQLSDRGRLEAERRAIDAGFDSVEAYVLGLVEQDTGVDSRLEALLSQRATAADAGRMESADFDAIRAEVRSASLGRAG